MIYDEDITKEQRDSYIDAFPFKVIWHPIKEVLSNIEITAKHKPSRFWLTPWYLASKLLDEYDSICILQGDEFLMSNVNSFFKVAAKTDIVIATEYHQGVEFEDLRFGDTTSVLETVGYALYDQLVFCGKESREILIDTYKQQCVDGLKPRNDNLYQDPLTALNQACTTHLSNDRIIGLDSQTWTWDKGCWSRHKLSYDKNNQRVHDREIRVHAWHSKWFFDGIVSSAIYRERQAGNLETADIIAHNYNLQREVMVNFNEMTPITKNNDYTKDAW